MATLPKLDVTTTSLLIVDPQRAFGEAVPVPGVTGALARMGEAAATWRALGRQVWVTRHAYHDAAAPGRLQDFIPHIGETLDVRSPLSDFYPGLVLASDRVMLKSRFSATVGTDLLKQLEHDGIDTVVVAGLTTPICVQATVDALSMQDYRVILLCDACASQAIGPLSAQQAHDAAIARMGYAFAIVMRTAAFVGIVKGP